VSAARFSSRGAIAGSYDAHFMGKIIPRGMTLVLFLLLTPRAIAAEAISPTSAPTTQRDVGAAGGVPLNEPRTIIYVCNGSTSMKGRSFELLKGELKKAIAVLPPVRAFDVIFFQDGKPAPFADQLLAANPRNKERAYDFLEHFELKGAGADPIPAMQLAQRLKPERIYLLADSSFDDNAKVIADIRSLRRAADAPPTRVDAIGFFRPDLPVAQREQTEATLKQIAADCGGTFKVVLTTDLEK
jgi:hypothetical protein